MNPSYNLLLHMRVGTLRSQSSYQVLPIPAIDKEASTFFLSTRKNI
jgi:hypothetical protein